MLEAGQQDGRYCLSSRTLSVRYLVEPGHKHVAGIRAMTMAGQVIRGDAIGDVPVDFGQIGLCDRDAVEHAFEKLGEARMSEYFEQLNTADLTAWVSLPGPVRMFIARPGFGDGTYSVYALSRADGMVVGIEVDCGVTAPESSVSPG